MMRVKTWKILNRGAVPENARLIPWTCRCGREAMLPIKGTPMAVTGDEKLGDVGIIFDIDMKGEMPTTIQCRRCGRVMTNEKENADVR